MSEHIEIVLCFVIPKMFRLAYVSLRLYRT